MGFSPTLYAIVFRILTDAKSPERAVRWITAGSPGSSIDWPASTPGPWW